MTPLTEEFFARVPLEVARDLVGATIRVRAADGSETAGRIVETEAYGGSEDPASHAARGMTPRSRVMFGPPGRIYIYLIYGVHHCLNFVTGAVGTPGAVLIRAIEPVAGQAVMARRRGLDPGRCRPRDLAAGPGRLCQALGLDLSWNGVVIGGDREGAAGPAGDRLEVCAGAGCVDAAPGPRIGVSRGTTEPYRFVDPASKCLSR